MTPTVSTTPPTEAIAALEADQRQLDQDGVFVGVSRQALDEVLAYIRSSLTSPPVAAPTAPVTLEDLQHGDCSHEPPLSEDEERDLRFARILCETADHTVLRDTLERLANIITRLTTASAATPAPPTREAIEKTIKENVFIGYSTLEWLNPKLGGIDKATDAILALIAASQSAPAPDIGTQAALDRLLQAIVASCTCEKKTHETAFHDEGCRYRLLTEVYDFICERSRSGTYEKPATHPTEPRTALEVHRAKHAEMAKVYGQEIADKFHGVKP